MNPGAFSKKKSTELYHSLAQELVHLRPGLSLNFIFDEKTPQLDSVLRGRERSCEVLCILRISALSLKQVTS